MDWLSSSTPSSSNWPLNFGHAGAGVAGADVQFDLVRVGGVVEFAVRVARFGDGSGEFGEWFGFGEDAVLDQGVLDFLAELRADRGGQFGHGRDDGAGLFDPDLPVGEGGAEQR